MLNKLNDLNAEYPGKVYLTAHSLGNVVAGEALRLAGNHQVVNTYIAMQGAVASHAYDHNTPVRALGALGAYDNGTPNRYAHYWTNGAPCYFNASAGAGMYVNFYNTNDWALETSIWGWTTDQNSKPDAGYSCNAVTGQFYRGTFIADELIFPRDTYEIFSYCVEARCHALGAQAGVNGVFNKREIDLHTVWPLDTYPQPSGPFSAHVWHSAEFRSDNSGRAVFWNTVLGRNGFNLK